jgi:hypothetical protein
MDREEQIRAEWLRANKEVSHWFRSTRSRTMLINGNSNLDRITPLSFFCAMLIQSLTPIKSIIVLSHFCGLNTPGDHESDERPRSSGLLQSLLTQLFEQWNFGKLNCLSQEDVEQLKSTYPTMSFYDQRHLLRKLVAAIPSAKPIFIIIDGINYYEISDFSVETEKVVKEINGLLSDSKIKVTVKIFVTSATRAFEVNKYFELDETIEMQQEDLFQSRVGHTDTQFELQFKPKISELEY